MAEFGRREPQRARPAQTLPRRAVAAADLRAAVAAARSGKLPHWTRVGPLRIGLTLLVVAGAFWALILPYAGDLLRDRRLAGTWQPAYDVSVTGARCTRYELTLTLCSADIRSLPEPGRAPVAIKSMMAFSSGKGEGLLAVRSTVDPSAVTVAFFAETELLNRTLTFAGLSAGFFVMILPAFCSLLRGRYAGGAAHRELLAGLEQLAARFEGMRAPSGGIPCPARPDIDATGGPTCHASRSFSPAP